MIHRISTAFVAVCLASIAQAATLEVPTPNTTVSGIGVISGWKCDIDGPLTVRFNGDTPIPLVYGSERADTRGVCGDTNNGFVTIWNWGNLGDGQYTAVVYDNGQEFARSTFRVVTTGEEFLRGASGTCEIPDFPAPGETARFKWNQSTQHLELDSVSSIFAPEPLAQSKIYWSSDPIPGEGKIQRANLDGSQVETVIEGDYGWDLAVDPTRGKIYWLRTGIHWANLDGSQVEILLPRPNSLHNRDNLAVDPTGGKLYWVIEEYSNETRTRRKEILRANWDGSQVETVAGTIGAYGLAVDLTGGKLYWVIAQQGHKEEIRRANLDGSQVEILFSVVTGPYRGLRDFDVDLTGGKLYWATGGELWRANLDGSQQIRIISGSEEPGFDAFGVENLAVDPIGGKLYWVHSIRYDHKYTREIRRANLDGSQVEILFDSPEIQDMTLTLK